MSRGNQKQNVFKVSQDYEVYLRLLRRYKMKFKVLLFGYCLMPNHVHLLVKPCVVRDLPKFMQGLDQSYALYFNARHHTCGHLWQGRFKSMAISSEDYFLGCIEYIEQNPVRAEIVQSASDYQWSSYRLRVSGVYDELLNSLDVPGLIGIRDALSVDRKSVPSI
ncbi:MAG TPA: transposase [Candidatus Omnitrophota bacterium]|nr:transposase [Candidatus Omnitrophota bacterium]HPD85641.1 transposase [Candidatus Omnitrophota bacterium]HRZ04484.1 transposase [Candidatus Omnitrophota bacterium]